MQYIRKYSILIRKRVTYAPAAKTNFKKKSWSLKSYKQRDVESVFKEQLIYAPLTFPGLF